MAEKDAVKGASGMEEEAPAPARRSGILGAFDWYFAWAIPGLGMFCEAYIVFSQGQISPFQTQIYPTCFKTITDCDYAMVKHVYSYITICGIMAGMLTWGCLGDIVGRKWGSRAAISIMLSGVIMLIFTPFTPSANGYFSYFITAQTWYGFGVGGEYPMASSSASERSATTQELRAYRGRQVVLVFSNQGLGNFVNACIILICMAMFQQSPALTTLGSRQVMALMYGIGALVATGTVIWRYTMLHESKLFKNVNQLEHKLDGQDGLLALALKKHFRAWYYFWPRQLVASAAWIANDFAFYGNKLQQNLFISILYPTATSYKKQQWTVLNNFIALTGYYTAAWLVDKPWYGRYHMQNVGFLAMFVFYIIIYGQWANMGAATATTQGAQAFQALYYLSSYFNQFGPNATTWLVAGEIFPTDIRTTNHGIAACMGKLGAIISAVWISYITDNRKVFLVSALWGLGGFVVTFFFLPDTTGLELEEYDRLQRYILEGRFNEYCGEAMNPRHLSLWEKYVMGWHKSYNPEQDKKNFEAEVQRLSAIPEAMQVLGNLHVIGQDKFQKISQGTA